jgi:hypothetical protein
LHNIPIERGQVVIAEVFDIPLQEVFKDVAAIQKEVGVSPATGRYDVEIRFHISAKPEQGEMTDTTAVFAFGLTSGGLILEAPKELSQSRHIAADASVEKPNVRRLFGQSIGVRDLANLYLYTAIVLLLAVTGLLLWKRRLGPAVKSASRYLSRFVEVQAVDTAQVTARIRMKKIDELVRLADEVESMLFRYSGDAQIPGIAGWETSYGAELLFTIHDSNFYYVDRSTRDEA